MTSPDRISLAYSPDTDDAFMVQAMRDGRVDLGPFAFDYVSADIQVLNDRARQGLYDVTAISVAAYPSIAADYLMMPIGASVGDDFGPALIVSGASSVRNVAELAGKRVAVPGRQTSAFFAACGLIGEFEAVALPFHEISAAVASGAVDAGILIHELQIDCERHGFRKLGDLGRLWYAQHRLPLPLGANAVRRALGTAKIAAITAIMRKSIEVGLADREATLRAALRQSGADLSLNLGDRYISMYVNERSLRMADDVRRAMGELFAIGEAHGLCSAVDLSVAICDA
jgi:1,4-dihydroxy-6-naphthoate synthase